MEIIILMMIRLIFGFRLVEMSSYLQSKEKLYKYFNNGTDMTLRDKNDLSLKELPKNNIFL